MRKILGLFLVVLLTSFFAMPAGAVSTSSDNLCLQCEKCNIPNIEIVDCASEQQDQEPCDYIDYETLNGYCGNVDKYLGKCKVLFNLCYCGSSPDDTFKAGNTIGFRITVLTEGVYLTDDSIKVALFSNQEDACDASYSSVNTWNDLAGDTYDYFDECDKDIPTGLPNDKEDGCIDSDDCAADRVVKMITCKDVGYVVTQDDVDNKMHIWWIDMPALLYDPCKVVKGSQLLVKVEIMDSTQGGICAECASVCYCVVDFGTLGCDDATIENCIYFPYVLCGSNQWFTGLAISNIGSTIGVADMMATFTLTDANQKVYTAKAYAADFGNKAIAAWSLDQLLTALTWSPKGTPEGPCWLKVDSNFKIDGYQFNLSLAPNAVFGAGVLPRPCWWWNINIGEKASMGLVGDIEDKS